MLHGLKDQPNAEEHEPHSQDTDEDNPPQALRQQRADLRPKEHAHPQRKRAPNALRKVSHEDVRDASNETHDCEREM